jgi:hypothetical protein
MKHFMLPLFASVVLSAQAIYAAEKIPASQIKRIQTQYSVTKNGQLFANVKEYFVVSNNSYTVESVTKGVGVYALFGERKLTSSGELTEAGLKPKRFELQQGDNPKKALSADFDWAVNQLNMTVKGKPKTAPLKPGTQDLASYVYQFMHLQQPFKESISVSVTTGKKLSSYTYAINPTSVSIQAGDATYETIQLNERDADSVNSVEEKSLWLSKAHYYLPIRIRFVDDEGVALEQTLTSLSVD